MDTFTQGSIVHGVCLLVCLAGVMVTVRLARRNRDAETRARSVRIVIVAGCLVSWLLSNGYGLAGGRFSWAESLPLHFCNLANLLGAYAVATRHRTSQALMYFWSFALCLWAFLTPSLYVGPAHLWFWLFWLYHLFIPVSTAWILVADRFRPTWRGDWGQSVLLTLAFMAALAVLDAITGWNYGFVGPSKPTQANLLDFLGPYPLRLVWMACVGTGLFAILMLPWMRRREGSGAALP
jgi:hypothetical integral membrane protein (TIGR02206 family)